MQYSLDKAREMCGGDEAFLKEIVYTFIQSLEEASLAISKAVEEEDKESLGYWSHRIKSNLHLFGCPDLETKARTIEEWQGEGALLFKMSRNFRRDLDQLRIRISED